MKRNLNKKPKKGTDRAQNRHNSKIRASIEVERGRVKHCGRLKGITGSVESMPTWNVVERQGQSQLHT